MKADKRLKKFSDFFELGSGILGEIATLGLLIKDSDSSIIAFAIFRGVANREMAVEALKERLNLPVAEFTLSSRQKNPVKFLSEVPFQERGCIFFFGLEDALPAAAGYLNLQRESFAEVPHAVVFWVSEYGLKEIANQAPDFWAWRSGVFDFRAEPAAPAAAIQNLAAIPFTFRDRHDLERRLNLYRELFNEYSRQGNPDEKFLAGLNLKQSMIYFHLGRFSEAESEARKALALAKQTGDKNLEASTLMVLSIMLYDLERIEEAESLAKQSLALTESLGPGNDNEIALIYYSLGNIALNNRHLDEAETWYRKAMEIYERLGKEEDVATSYYQLGMVALQRGQLDIAEKFSLKALESFERLGLEQYMAYVYLQLGRIAHERSQLEIAEQWYQKSLKIAERSGLEKDAANAYHYLGIIAKDSEQLESAEKWLLKSLEIYERLNMERDVADEYQQLGIVARMREQLEAAEQHFLKALEIYERLSSPRRVFIIALLGTLSAQKENFDRAILFLGQAWAVAGEYPTEISGNIIRLLALIFEFMGEADFSTAWRQHFPDKEPPLAAIHQSMEKIEQDGD